jgi:putative endonuclease
MALKKLTKKTYTNMKTIYVYILKCSDNSYYTGVTNDLDRRLQEHNKGIEKDCYTYNRRPVKLVFCEMFDSPEAAILFEKKIKGWTRIKKESLIEGSWNKLHELAKCKNETSHINYEGSSLRLHSG